jgi:hypothetical protein
MIFIKESKKSNLKTLQASLRKNGEPIDNENDWIFYYSWADYGKFFEKEKSDSGKMPSSKNIKIENIPVKADSIKR